MSEGVGVGVMDVFVCLMPASVNGEEGVFIYLSISPHLTSPHLYAPSLAHPLPSLPTVSKPSTSHHTSHTKPPDSSPYHSLLNSTGHPPVIQPRLALLRLSLHPLTRRSLAQFPEAQTPRTRGRFLRLFACSDWARLETGQGLVA
jgi:hypothetical protein